MRFAGIDIGAERHMLAVLDEQGEILCRSSPFGEDDSGYTRLFELLGPPDDLWWRWRRPAITGAIYSSH
jgi:hypothetical protein